MLVHRPGKIRYTFKQVVWKYEGQAAWYFVSVPQSMAHEIRTHFQSEEAGWGRLKVTASVGQTAWETAIWYDTRQQTYLLPLKAAIRKKEQLNTGSEVAITLWI